MKLLVSELAKITVSQAARYMKMQEGCANTCSRSLLNSWCKTGLEFCGHQTIKVSLLGCSDLREI